MDNVSNHPDNENIVNVGSDYRIEPGPKLKTAVATEELLHNDNSNEQYHAPYDAPDDENGGELTRFFAKDAFGKPIILGKEFSYLDRGGNVAEADTTFYIYKKEPVNSTSEFLKDGEVNPHFVPKHVRDLAKTAAPGEFGYRGEDRVYIDYKWVEVATRQTLEAAIEYCNKKAS